MASVFILLSKNRRSEKARMRGRAVAHGRALLLFVGHARFLPHKNRRKNKAKKEKNKNFL